MSVTHPFTSFDSLSSLVDVVLDGDKTNNGIGAIVFKIAGVEVARFNNDGELVADRIPEITSFATDRTPTSADHGDFLKYTGTGPHTVTLDSGEQDGFHFVLIHAGASGTLTITSTQNINGDTADIVLTGDGTLLTATCAKVGGEWIVKGEI